jgi:Fe-S cluster assembly protein SufD
MALAQAKLDLTEARLADLSSPEGRPHGPPTRARPRVARVRAEGLPTRRDEYWKYTDPASLTQAPAPRRRCSTHPAKRRFSTGSTG